MIITIKEWNKLLDIDKEIIKKITIFHNIKLKITKELTGGKNNEK